MTKTIRSSVPALLLVLPLVGGGSTSDAAAQSKPTSTEALKASEADPAETAQLPLIEAADKLMAHADSVGRPGFAGMRLDDAASAVIVQWKGRPPASLLELAEQLRSRTVGIRFVDVQYSLEELMTEARRIASAEIPRVRITGVGPLEDSSGLRVWVEPADLIRAAETVKSNMKLEFEAMGEPTLVSNR